MFWMLFTSASILTVVIVLLIDRKKRTEFYAEINNDQTIISDVSGKIVLSLSNQLVLMNNGKIEEIIAVGKQGEVGFTKAHALPSGARIVNLTNLSNIDSKKAYSMWRTYLIYCQTLILTEIYGNDHNINSSLISSRLFINIEYLPTQLRPLFKKSIFGWLLGNPLFLPKKNTY